MSDDHTHPFIEIKDAKAIYRFYGFGKWDVNYGEKWEPINGIYVPGDVLKVAADEMQR
jgi:hypothetical protein